jgi:hypothetical protein
MDVENVWILKPSVPDLSHTEIQTWTLWNSIEAASGPYFLEPKETGHLDRTTDVHQ